MAYVLLLIAQVAGLLLIPFGLPGLWLQVAALALFAWANSFATVGLLAVAVAAALALVAELVELLLGARYARRYGGGRRAAWGAVLGGVVGALLGVPVPLVGSVIGAFLGAFVGALLGELSTGRGGAAATRAGWGALVGRVVATAMKGTVGVVLAVLSLIAAWG